MLSEAQVFLGPRYDKWVTLPVTMLETLNKLVVDGVVVEFRTVTRGENAGTQFLMRCKASRVRYQEWVFVEDKDRRRIIRRAVPQQPVEILWL